MLPMIRLQPNVGPVGFTVTFVTFSSATKNVNFFSLFLQWIRLVVTLTIYS